MAKEIASANSYKKVEKRKIWISKGMVREDLRMYMEKKIAHKQEMSILKSMSMVKIGDPRINWFKAEFILGNEVKPKFL